MTHLHAYNSIDKKDHGNEQTNIRQGLNNKYAQEKLQNGVLELVLSRDQV